PVKKNCKSYHTNLLFERWHNNEKKTVFSRRLGITFEESIHARTDNGTRRTFNKHMYKKKLFNFSFSRSDNARVSKAQEIRFERSKRRIFNSKEHNPLNRRRHRLITAQRYRFLYTHSQHYSYAIPTDDVSFLNPTIGVAPYNPIPDMFIPAKYRNIIPKDPIYDEQGVFITPGSREWFTYMYNLHINLPPPLTKAQRRARREQNEMIMRNNRYREEAKFHGTSFNRIIRRKVAVKSLTTITNNFDEAMKDFVLRYQNSNHPFDKGRIHLSMINHSLRLADSRFNHRNTMQEHSAVPSGAPEDTSDDTIVLERRPKKRRIPLNANIYFSSPEIYHRSKRLCVSSAFMDDSTEKDASIVDNYSL
ncbi:hypothetical protein RhiirA4_478388, partial [Rhizophagus irregularis]